MGFLIFAIIGATPAQDPAQDLKQALTLKFESLGSGSTPA
jgi:hypothetical protein